MIKYSKSSSFYSKLRMNFLTENDSFLGMAIAQNALYSKQIKREKCKICCSGLGNSVDFVSHGASYVFCQDCNHLNGCFEDTNEFANNIYILWRQVTK
jgi:hypothetical protein